MSTDDTFSRLASLESQLAEEIARGVKERGISATMEMQLEAEKASHTQTLAELALVKEALAASEAERVRLAELKDTLKLCCSASEQTLWRTHRFVTGKDVVSPNYAECERGIVEACAALEFLRKNGDAIVAMLRQDSHADALADELEELVFALETETMTVPLPVDPDEYMSADHDDTPTEPMASKEPG